MEEGCFRSGVTTNDRATIGGGEGREERCLHRINRFVMVERKNGAQTVPELRRNVLRSEEYARVFRREHQKNLIQLHVR